MTSQTPSEKTMAQRLRDAREAAGLSQAQVANKLNLHRPSVTEIEAGRRKVSADEIEAFADVYGVSTDWLLNGKAIDSTENAKVLLAARELSKMKPDDVDRLMRMLKTLKAAK